MLVPDPQTPAGERTKLLDFGIAKVMETESASGVRTKTNQLMGTPTYMSPEQCEGAGNVDDKSDVYALGVMLFEMIAGRPPFVADGAGKVLGMHILVEPPLLRELAPETPRALTDRVQELLAKNRHERPTMRKLADSLEALAELHPLQRRSGRGAASEPGRPGGVSAAGRIAGWEPSTLGSVASQVLPRGRELRRLGLALGGAAVACVAAVSLALTRHPGEHKTGAAASALAQPAAVTLRVQSSPPGAELVRVSDGVVLGRTPLQITQPAGRGLLRLRVSLAGHQAHELALRDDVSSESSVKLSPEPPAPSAAAAAEAPLAGPADTGARAGAPRNTRTTKARRIYVKPPLEK